MIKVHEFQNAEYINGSIISAENLPERLEVLLTDLHRIEKKLHTAAQKTASPEIISYESLHLNAGLTLEARVENADYLCRKTLVDDWHLYCGISWRQLILQCVGHCYMSFNLNKLEHLAQVREKVPPLFATLFPEDMEVIPSQMNTFVFALEEILDEGATLEEVNALGDLHGLARFGVVMQTLLDRLEETGQLEKALKNDQVAYWSFDIS
jgi:hypothetical protein